MNFLCQHTYAHHSFTNIDGADPDVTTVSQYIIILEPFKKL